MTDTPPKITQELINQLQAQLDAQQQPAEQSPDETRQLTRADLKDMTPEQVLDARERGQLDNLMGGAR